MVHSSFSNNSKKILVDGQLDSEDIKNLHHELSDDESCDSIEINFIDVKYISGLILKDLYRIKDKSSILTTHRSLWGYLNKFNIRNVYKSNYHDISTPTPHSIKAIGIGGSAGSIPKLLSIIESLPYTDISVFITIHILPDKQSRMVDILQEKTNYKVYEAVHNTKVQKNCIYIAPPNSHLLVVDGYVYLSTDNEVSFARPSIDVLFKSLAYEYKKSLITILLCGYGSDGTNSLKYLKDNKSTVIIEDPSDCEAKDMLISAIDTKNYFKVLNCENIQNYIQSLLYTNIDISDEIEVFLENIYLTYGYDFRSYSRKSLERRLELMIKNNNFQNFKQFKMSILEDYTLFDKLLRAFSINVTEFFRNPTTFESIRETILPSLETYPFIRVWCAGCSRGDEPYSVAMILDEAGLLEKSQIYATDFNTTILSEASNGIYPNNLMSKFEENYIQSGGEESFKNYFEISQDFIEVKQKLKDKVLFFEHNLVSDGSINEFHLVFCRNVLIYFDKTLQKKVFKTIDESLNRDSFLVLGESEIIEKKYNYTIVGKKKDKIYQKQSKKF